MQKVGHINSSTVMRLVDTIKVNVIVTSLFGHALRRPPGGQAGVTSRRRTKLTGSQLLTSG